MRTKQSNARKLRAFSLLAHDKVDLINDFTYRVWSQSGNSYYIVVREGLEWKCECSDFKFNRVVCKHIHAVEQLRLYQQSAFPSGKEGESLCEVEASLVCKFCGSEQIVKRGHRVTQMGNVQRYFCKNCGRKFVVNDGFEKMKSTPQTVTVALDLYFKGISLRKIIDHLKQFYGVEVSHVAVFKWIKKYVELMKEYVDQLVPNVSGIWHSDEMMLNVNGELKWLWNVMDNQSRFWLASQITEQRETEDARLVLAEARNMAKVKPLAVVTDGLRAYEHAITREFHTMKAPITEHIRIPNIRNRSNNNMIERLHGTIRERNKVMRGLDDKSTAQTIIDGMKIYYNFIRPHQALNGKTPAEKAKISKLEQNKWRSLINKSIQNSR
jgi:putative transposase